MWTAWYYDGNGVAQGYPEGVRLARLAVEQGYSGGPALLGHAYHYGLGVTQDYGEAVRWAQLAAEQNAPAL